MSVFDVCKELNEKLENEEKKQKSNRIKLLKAKLSECRKRECSLEIKFVLAQTLNREHEKRIKELIEELNEVKLRCKALESVAVKKTELAAMPDDVQTLRQIVASFEDVFYKMYFNNMIKRNQIHRLLKKEPSSPHVKQLLAKPEHELQEKVNFIKLFKKSDFLLQPGTNSVTKELVSNEIEVLKTHLKTLKHCFGQFQAFEKMYIKKMVGRIDKKDIEMALRVLNVEENTMNVYFCFLLDRLEVIMKDYEASNGNNKLQFETSLFDLISVLAYINDMNSFKASKINELNSIECLNSGAPFPTDKAAEIFMKVTETMGNYEAVMDIFKNYFSQHKDDYKSEGETEEES